MGVWIGTEDGLHGLSGEVELRGHRIDALAVDEPVWWVVTDDVEIRRWENGQWDSVTTLEDLSARCVARFDGGALVGTSEAHLIRIAGAMPEPVFRFDAVEGRERWYTPWGGPPDSRSISVGADGTVYVNVHVGGIVRSRDGGESWEPTIDVDADVHQVLAHPSDPSRVYAACAPGLAESTDGGDSWTIVAEGLHAPYSRAVALAGDTLLLTASTGPHGGLAAVYRRSLKGGAFEKCTAGLPEWLDGNIDSMCLASDGTDVVFGTEEGEVYRSADAGSSWELAVKDLPPVRGVVFG